MNYSPYHPYMYVPYTYPTYDRLSFPSIGGVSIPGFPPIGGGNIPSFPGAPQGGPPSFPPFGGQNTDGIEQGAPTSPPPSFTPQLTQSNVSTLAVDAGSMRPCLFRFTYVWLNNGNAFWFYPTFVGRTSVAGFRWRRNRWTFYGTDTNRIRSFQCF